VSTTVFDVVFAVVSTAAAFVVSAVVLAVVSVVEDVVEDVEADEVPAAAVEVFDSVIPRTLSTEANETPMDFAICDALCPSCFNAWICWVCVSRTVSVDLLAAVEAEVSFLELACGVYTCGTDDPLEMAIDMIESSCF